MEKVAKCNDNKLSDLCQGGILTVWKFVYLRAVFRGPYGVNLLSNTIIWWRYIYIYISKLNSVALVRTRTIPTERPPPVGEVSANFCG